ncbi:phosphoglycerate dehydrogenase [Streptomyces armeniacus]|uniref:Phosphoglycerate dehydrogenase n=1 Tax=Streptomyces armeniacus TaxID=83291 RepID=A0A345XZF8_9ACTN|nr:phosphoglycerate dehydrogenase [Streptomyces armeniacus]
MPPPDVAVVEDVWGEPFDALGTRLRVRREPGAWSDPRQLYEAAAGARALVVRNRTRVTGELLAALPRLALVARAGVGLDNIDVAAADARGVVVVAALGANATSVAEYTLGAALALARRTVPLDRRTRAGGWERDPVRELSGGTWGLLGLGATGLAVARAARALDMRVVAYDPYVRDDDPRLAEYGVRLAALDDTAAAADVLSVHLPATPATRGMVGARLLSLLPPGALLVSAGRGAAVDEEALADALAGGRLGGAALDVRAVEPPSRGRLEDLDNVLLTPHVAGITEQSQRRIARILAEDIERVLTGGAAAHAVGAVDRGREPPHDG